MKKIILTLIAFFPLFLFSQKKFYENRKKEILNEKEYKNKKKSFLAEAKLKYGEDQTIDENISLKSSSKDSIVYNYWLATMPMRLKLEKDKLRKLKTKKFLFEGLEFLNPEEKVEIDPSKPTFVSFWFTKCPPCIQEIPALNDLKEKYDGKINFVAITFDTKEQVKPFLETHHFPYIHIVNERQFLENIGIKSYPKIFILDKNQIIVDTDDRLEGKSNEKTYKNLIKKMEEKLDNLL